VRTEFELVGAFVGNEAADARFLLGIERLLLARTSPPLLAVERNITLLIVTRLPFGHDLPRHANRIGSLLLRFAIEQHGHGKTTQLCLRRRIKSRKSRPAATHKAWTDLRDLSSICVSG